MHPQRSLSQKCQWTSIHQLLLNCSAHWQHVADGVTHSVLPPLLLRHAWLWQWLDMCVSVISKMHQHISPHLEIGDQWCTQQCHEKSMCSTNLIWHEILEPTSNGLGSVVSPLHCILPLCCFVEATSESMLQTRTKTHALKSVAKKHWVFDVWNGAHWRLTCTCPINACTHIFCPGRSSPRNI